MRELISELVPLCCGRLNMTPAQIRKSYIADITLMLEGWQQRYYDQQDLFILYSALPVYQTQCKNPPKYEDFVKNRRNNHDNYSDMSMEELSWLASEEE